MSSSCNRYLFGSRNAFYIVFSYVLLWVFAQEEFLIPPKLNYEPKWREGYVKLMDDVLELRYEGSPTIRFKLVPYYPDQEPLVEIADGTVKKELVLSNSQRICHWTNENSPRIFDDKKYSVYISNCQHPKFFTGIIATSEGVWLIQPNVMKNRSRRRRSMHRSHLILPPDESVSALLQASQNVDVLHVPLPELREAAKLAYLEQQSDAVPLILNRKVRSDSSSNKKKWVEMAVFSDESLYKSYQKKNNSTSEKVVVAAIKDYANTLVHAMDILYSDKTLDNTPIGFRLVHLQVMKSSAPELDTNDGKAKAYLSSFCDWAGNLNYKGSKWDHALLLTGVDLHEAGLKSTAGLAWAGTMCYRYYSCSVAEGTSLGAAFVVTHEIGHSLGMEHDGYGVAKACDKTKWIMSPTTGAGKTKWSNCSAKSLQDFLSKGTEELRSEKDSSLLSTPYCLSQIVADEVSLSINAKKKNRKDGKIPLPGETHDAFTQCKLSKGDKFKPYLQRDKPPFHNICWMLYCGNGTHAISTHPALEGTKCDRNKYCRGGKCVKKLKNRKGQ